MLVIGIDPSSGSSSPVGLAVFDPHTKEILLLTELRANKKDSVHHRLVSLHDQLAELLMSLNPNERTYVYMENFVMQGKNGQLLANASGALMCAVPTWCEYGVVQNTTVKKLVGGNGRAEKLDVGLGCLKHFKGSPDEHVVKAAIDLGEFDKLDALAIGLAGYQRECGNG